MKKIIFVIVALLSVCGEALSQSFDTLHSVPYLYKYKWDSVGVDSNGVMCALTENAIMPIGITYDGVAYYQHTDEPLMAVGVAYGGSYTSLRNVQFVTHILLLDSTCKELAHVLGHSDEMLYTQALSDSNVHGFFVAGLQHSMLVNGEILCLRYALFEEPIEVTGDFYLGIYDHKFSSNTDFVSTYRAVWEYHALPHHIPPLRARKRIDGEWHDTVIPYGGMLPEMFLIVEPDCGAVERTVVRFDSLGSVVVEWDSLAWHDGAVVHLRGPEGDRYDTVAGCHHVYSDLEPYEGYEVSVIGQCYRPGGHSWATTESPSVMFYAPMSAAAVAVATWSRGMELSPNPSAGRTRVTVEGYEGPATVTVVDVAGVEVMRADDVSLPMELDTRTLPTGLYLLRVSAPAVSAAAKLAVRH